ncbi:ATP-binding cassette domain-containing protein [Paenibacillus guangzhouensis]|uniref:ATP-binding cassette domain-containing protein n=1 Tax=Paenibacillus guangzhouensis TaxID=1473112 RepID=UPI001266985F|nr:ABC transporter ATP-binding protein [Paenibacillus guangzhouensis]
MKLLEAVCLSKAYGERQRWFTQQTRLVSAVEEVSLSLERGKTLGLVGESGSGKSTLGRLLLGLEKPTSGQVLYRNTDITALSSTAMRKIRRSMQSVFQNSLSSFNPLFTVEQIVEEPLQNYKTGTPKEIKNKVVESLELVGLGEQHLRRYPHELSGGQQQRVGIGRAIALRPEVLVCDEPFASLDVSLRRQMLNLLQGLKSELRLSYLFITHDLSLIDGFCDQVAVMHEGRIVECLPGNEMKMRAVHPYTKSLLEAVPVQEPRLRRT